MAKSNGSTIMQRIDKAKRIFVYIDTGYSPLNQHQTTRVSRAEAKRIVRMSERSKQPSGAIDPNGDLILIHNN